ncbi:MAG: 39S ribosomal protein L45 [Rickettsiales bacterium]|jgi:predicted lipid-binding transport protein (Tim44 family)|nr:39S ribosomal protein L45 [Rickettsiales bacterium]
MDNILLGLLMLVTFRILFKKFGSLSEKENEKKQKAIRDFLSGQSGDASTCCSERKRMKIVEALPPATTNENTAVKSDAKTYIAGAGRVFDEELFLKQSEDIATSLLDAFNRKDMEMLKNICSGDVFDMFKKNIELSTQNGETYRAVIVSFLEKKILEKTYDYSARTFYVFLRMKTEQINYVENGEGKIERGSRDNAQTVDEMWTFGLVNPKKNIWEVISINEYR